MQDKALTGFRECTGFINASSFAERQ